MRKAFSLSALLAASLSLQACAPLLQAMTGPNATGTPPQLPESANRISRTAVDFALHSFDAALYGLDWAMDAGRLTPGSEQARSIARVGRQVMNFLGVADAAQRLGNSETYEEAFANATRALAEFRNLAGMAASPTFLQQNVPHMSEEQRNRILDRLESNQPPTI